MTDIKSMCKWKFILWVLVVLIMACDEEKKIIVPFIPAGDRVVLLEEFTGKACSNCPKGSREIENLLTQFPDNLVVVSIHAGLFAEPQIPPIGQYDFRTVEGEILYDYLAPILGYPSGVVDRTPVNGDLQISSNAWASAITSEIQIPPAVELNITKDYNPATRQLSVTVNGIGKETLTEDIHLSIMITESGIVDAQDDLEAGGIVPNYVHNHVLRAMLTPALGALILNALGLGQTFTDSYSITLDSTWVPEHMNIVAFITGGQATVLPVLQATSVQLIP